MILWYYLVKGYLKTALYFYFKKIVVVGQEHIPKKGAVLFVANHQNALMDSLLIATTNKRHSYYLARASVFKNPIIKRILHSVNMIPIYRIRDGWQSLDKNKGIFRHCYKILNHKKAILIFPEGNHDLNRRVRPLSKGFTKIIFGTLIGHPDLNIQIVPVGLNYDEHQKYPQSVAIYYGKPILANPFFDTKNIPKSARALTLNVRNELKTLTTHIDNLDDYQQSIAYLKHVEADFLNPIKTNKLLLKLKDIQEKKHQNKTPKLAFRFVYGLIILSVWLPYLIWHFIKPKITDKVFTSTFRFAISATLIPLFCLLQGYVFYLYYGWQAGLLFMAFCLSLIFLLKWMPYRHL